MTKEEILDLDNIIEYMEETDPKSWCTDVVKTDNNKNCFFGHFFDYAGGDDNNPITSECWDMFEACIATTFMIYPVNDGEDDRYQQETAKGRVIAYLKDLRDGKAKTTQQIMEEDYQRHMNSMEVRDGHV